jgi:urea carboxylase-associated protein 2
MRDLDDLTPAEYRARYEALQAKARARAGSPKPVAKFSDIAEADIVSRDAIPPGWYACLRIKRGAALRITNPTGTPGAAFFLWNADDTSERYNAGDTAKLQWTTNLTAGRVLFSDMGRVLASITADTKAGHDTIIGPNGPAQAGTARNGRDNLRSGAAKFGLSRRDVGPAISLFSPVAVDAQGCMRFTGNPPAGAMLELRAEMNLLALLSNTPHALSPVPQSSGPIEYILHRAPAPEPDDFCRNFTEEAARGFINNDGFFAA